MAFHERDQRKKFEIFAEFPAAILKAPSFDRDRPAYMNFGAIGTVIGHEITHAFDDQASKIETWSESSKTEYRSRVKCLIDQYSSYRVKEVEEYFADENIGEVHLNGNHTQKEDIADCGGLKLALNAYKKYEQEFPDSDIVPIGLEDFSNDQLFWISFAQTFCSVSGPKQLRTKIESDEHSVDRFRIIGAVSNMKEFSKAFNCKDNDPMNPQKKCAVW